MEWFKLAIFRLSQKLKLLRSGYFNRFNSCSNRISQFFFYFFYVDSVLLDSLDYLL